MNHIKNAIAQKCWPIGQSVSEPELTLSNCNARFLTKTFTMVDFIRQLRDMVVALYIAFIVVEKSWTALS